MLTEVQTLFGFSLFLPNAPYPFQDPVQNIAFHLVVLPP